MAHLAVLFHVIVRRGVVTIVCKEPTSVARGALMGRTRYFVVTPLIANGTVVQRIVEAFVRGGHIAREKSPLRTILADRGRCDARV